MSFNYKANPNLYPEHLNLLIRLSELQQMTDHLDDELADSQKVMMNIKTMFDSIPNTQNAGTNNSANSVVRHEDLSQFLVASPPQLLMEDMPANTVEVDVDVIINTMKKYAEDLRKNFVLTQPQPASRAQRGINNLDLGGYASSLDQLVKRLANVKLNKHDEANNRNADLEAKLEQLCKDVNRFTQMVEAKKALSESNSNWTTVQDDNIALYYDNVINKLLAGINEVTYLLKNKN